jgi:hypothetical protein
MNIFLASTADLYAEHRRTQSRRKREKIAAELQRRHDELLIPAGMSRDKWWQPTGEVEFVREPLSAAGGHYEPLYHAIRRFEFAIWLP